MCLAATRTSQGAMAKQFDGISIQAICRLTQGQAKSIPLDTLARLAAWAYRHNFSTLWLFCGEGDMHTDKETPE